MTSAQQIQKMYIAYYGRPADPAGLAWWVAQAETQGMEWVFEAFTQSPEFDIRYSSKGQAETINDWFDQAFGRPATQQEVNDFRQQMNEGVSRGQLLQQLLNKAENDPAGQQVLSNRTQVAEQFTRQVEQTGASYTLADVQTANNLLRNVDSSAASAQQALEKVSKIETGKPVADVITDDSPALATDLGNGVWQVHESYNSVSLIADQNTLTLRGNGSAKIEISKDQISTLDTNGASWLSIEPNFLQVLNEYWPDLKLTGSATVYIWKDDFGWDLKLSDKTDGIALNHLLAEFNSAYQSWLNGQNDVVLKVNDADVAGEFVIETNQDDVRLSVNNNTYKFEVHGESGSTSTSFTRPNTDISKIIIPEGVTLSLDGDTFHSLRADGGAGVVLDGKGNVHVTALEKALDADLSAITAANVTAALTVDRDSMTFDHDTNSHALITGNLGAATLTISGLGDVAFGPTASINEASFVLNQTGTVSGALILVGGDRLSGSKVSGTGLVQLNLASDTDLTHFDVTDGLSVQAYVPQSVDITNNETLLSKNVVYRWVNDDAVLTLTAEQANTEFSSKVFVKNVNVQGSDGDQRIDLSYSTGTNTIAGGKGADTIILAEGAGTDTIVIGGGVTQAQLQQTLTEAQTALDNDIQDKGADSVLAQAVTDAQALVTAREALAQAVTDAQALVTAREALANAVTAAQAALTQDITDNGDDAALAQAVTDAQAALTQDITDNGDDAALAQAVTDAQAALTQDITDNGDDAVLAQAVTDAQALVTAREELANAVTTAQAALTQDITDNGDDAALAQAVTDAETALTAEPDNETLQQALVDAQTAVAEREELKQAVTDAEDALAADITANGEDAALTQAVADAEAAVTARNALKQAVTDAEAVVTAREGLVQAIADAEAAVTAREGLAQDVTDAEAALAADVTANGETSALTNAVNAAQSAVSARDALNQAVTDAEAAVAARETLVQAIADAEAAVAADVAANGEISVLTEAVTNAEAALAADVAANGETSVLNQNVTDAQAAVAARDVLNGAVAAAQEDLDAAGGQSLPSDSTSTAYDSIINFQTNGDDKLQLGYVDTVWALDGEAISANEDIDNLSNGIVTFSAGVTGLSAKFDAIFDAMGTAKATAAFVHDDNTYVVQNDGVAGTQASDIVVELVGVSVTDLGAILTTAP